MRSRRNFIGGTVGIAALLSGCIGQLGSDDSDGGDSGPKGPEDLESWEEPMTGIFVWGDQASLSGEATYEVEVSGNPREASHIEYRIGGEEVFTMHQDTPNPTDIANGVEEGERVEAIAVYENGETRLLKSRCIHCD